MKVKAILVSGAGVSARSSSPSSEYNDDRAPQEDSNSFALRIPTPFPFPLPETGEDRRGGTRPGLAYITYILGVVVG